jgi:hypothetical protein
MTLTTKIYCSRQYIHFFKYWLLEYVHFSGYLKFFDGKIQLIILFVNF